MTVFSQRYIDLIGSGDLAEAIKIGQIEIDKMRMENRGNDYSYDCMGLHGAYTPASSYSPFSNFSPMSYSCIAIPGG